MTRLSANGATPGRGRPSVGPPLLYPASPKATDFLPILGDSPVAILHQRAESWGTCRRVGRARGPTWSSRGRRWVERRSCGTRRRSCRCVLFLAQGVPLVDPRNTVTHKLPRPDVSSCDLGPSTARYSRRHDGLRPARDPAAESALTTSPPLAHSRAHGRSRTCRSRTVPSPHRQVIMRCPIRSLASHTSLVIGCLGSPRRA